MDIDPADLWSVHKLVLKGQLEARLKIEDRRGLSVACDIVAIDAAKTFSEAIKGNFPSDLPQEESDFEDVFWKVGRHKTIIPTDEVPETLRSPESVSE